MKGVVCEKYGGPEVLDYKEDLPKPKPEKNQVLVQMKVIGVNPVDVYLCGNLMQWNNDLPFIPGMDGAGTVEEVGGDVTRFKVGDRVFFSSQRTSSASAEYCACDEQCVGHLPENASFEDGATIGIPYFTAYKALWQLAHVKKGDNVLIQGATGGVGTATVQFLVANGIDFIATSGTEDGNEMLRKLGATKIYNHRKAGYMDEIKANEKPVTVIIESFANHNLANDFDLLSFGGRIVVIGSRGTAEINPQMIFAKEMTIYGLFSLGSTPEQYKAQVEACEKGLKEGWIKPPIWRKYNIKEIKSAHKDIMENTGAKGQMVVTFD